LPGSIASAKRRNSNIQKNLKGTSLSSPAATREIAAAIAKPPAADGANPAINYAKVADAAYAIVKAVEQAGRKARAMQADAADANAVKSAVEKTAALSTSVRAWVNACRHRVSCLIRRQREPSKCLRKVSRERSAPTRITVNNVEPGRTNLTVDGGTSA
jgi:hypothetical protein